MDSFPVSPTAPVNLRSPTGSLLITRVGAAFAIDLNPSVLAASAFLKGDKGDKGNTGAKGDQGAQGNPTTVNGYTGATIVLNADDVGAWSDGKLTPQSKKIHGRQRKFLLSDYGGGESTAAADNVTAFNAAYADLVTAGGGTLVLTGGDIPVSGAIGSSAVKAVGVQIVGSSPLSRLVFSGAGVTNGLILNAYCPKLEGFKVKAQSAANLVNGSLVYVRDAAPLGSSFGQPLIADLALEGAADAKPSAFLNIINPAHGRCDRVTVVAFSPTPYGTASRGILFSGDTSTNGNATGDHSINGCTVYGAQIGFEVDAGVNGAPTVEGSSFTDCVVVGAQTGLSMHANGYLAPGHSWKGGHLNCSVTCMSFTSMSQFTVSDALMYLDRAQTSPGNQGFILFQNSAQMHAHSNKFYHLALNGADTTQGCYGVAFSGTTSGSRATNNDATGFASGSGVVFGPSTAGGNRAGGNGKSGSGTVVSGNVTDLGGNHTF